MLLDLLLGAGEGGANQQQTQTNNGGGNWIVWVIFAVMIVGMILLTVLPNRKRQKEYQKMQDEIRIGTRIMTIGRMIGTITKIYPDNTIEVDVGTPGNPVIITINREAIGVNLTVQEQIKAAQEAQKNKKNGTAPKTENTETAEENVENAEISENTESAETTENEKVESNEDDAI